MGDISKHRKSFLVSEVIVEDGDRIVLIKRGHEPFKSFWAFPAGFVEPDELVEQAALREVKEETGLDIKLKGIVGVYSSPGRDPRGDVVAICFIGEKIGGSLKGMDDAVEAKVFPREEVKNMKLAFDESEMIKDYFEMVK